MRVALICVGLAAAASSAHAEDPIGEARRLQTALEYDAALAVVQATLARGGADPGQLAELHLLAGELTAGLDRPAEAEDHFARALALRPDTALAAGTSPKLTTPFEAARARTGPLVVHATALRGVVAVIVDRDPLRLAAGIAVRVVAATGEHSEVVARDALRVAIPPGGTAIEVAALDATGNRIWIGAAPAELLLPLPRAREVSLVARPLPWAIATATLGLAGGACAWRTSSLHAQWAALRADDGHHAYSELDAIESRGKRYAIAADVLFALAATAAVATVVVYLGESSTLVASPASVGFAARF